LEGKPANLTTKACIKPLFRAFGRKIGKIGRFSALLFAFNTGQKEYFKYLKKFVAF